MKEIDFKDVCKFIIDNSDDVVIMDKLNKITFPFTSNYRCFKSEKVDLSGFPFLDNNN